MTDLPTSLDAGRLRVVIVRLSRELRRHSIGGLTPTQLSALTTVERCGPVRLGELAASEGITPSTLTRLVSVLEERGYVDRRTDPGDARSSRVAVTPRGQRLLSRNRDETTAALAERLNDLTPEQRLLLDQALPALEQLADMPRRRAETKIA